MMAPFTPARVDLRGQSTICRSSFNMIKSIELITKGWLRLSSNNKLHHEQ
jgi:hypothetical protein